MMPITALTTITSANRASIGCPNTSTTPASTVMIALKRVNTLARTISAIDRDVRRSVRLT